MKMNEAISLVANHSYWHQSYEIFPGVMTNGCYSPKHIWEKMEIPEDLNGVRVLDIGANDGYFSMMLTLRGADVVAYDYQSKLTNGFSIMEKVNKIEIKYIRDNINNIQDHSLGKFDIVLFLGVLYHLPDPLQALHSIYNLCDNEMYLESIVCIDEALKDHAVMKFYPGATLNNDITNFWSPTEKCLLEMIQDFGFEVLSHRSYGDRSLVRSKKSMDSQSEYRKHIAYGLWPDATAD